MDTVALDTVPSFAQILYHADDHWEEAYAKRVQIAREKEYPQLRDIVYLDHAASPPNPQSLLQLHAQKLTNNLWSNPHSHSPSSTATHQEIERIRALVLSEVFGVNPLVNREADFDEGWDLIWTSGATAGLKLIGDSFEWNGSGEFMYLQEAHTSLVGVRDLAKLAGATVRAVTMDDLQSGKFRERSPKAGPRLIGLPLQCNATGRQYSSQLSTLRANSTFKSSSDTYILVDAAAWISSYQTRLDLGAMSYDDAPDFIAFSFYKALAYPTGLGGLVVKRQSGAKMLGGKKYYGGGTVEALTVQTNWMAPRGLRKGSERYGEKLIERMEDGTINFQGILAVPIGLEILDRVFGKIEDRKRYVRWLTKNLFCQLLDAKHSNGAPMIRLYSNSASLAQWRTSSGRMRPVATDLLWDQGATVNFNVLAPFGQVLAPADVESLASASNIHLRQGRHCNSGVMSNIVGLSEDIILEMYRRGLGCDDLGSGTDGVTVWASVRASLGVSNTIDDVDIFVKFLTKTFMK